MERHVSFERKAAVSGRRLPDLVLVGAAGVVVFLICYKVGAFGEAMARVRQAAPVDALGTACCTMLATATVLAVRRCKVMSHEVARLRAAESLLVAAKEEAEALAQLRASFLASVSHEVRTPLAGIIGFASVLEAELPPEKRELAQIVKESGERLVETLNSILDLTRLEAGVIAPRFERCDVAMEVEDTVRMFRRIAESKGLYLHVEVPQGELFAWLDAAFLHRILNNLVSNAVKFTQTGGITVRASGEGGRVTISVQDTGIGISEEVLPRIFDEFVQEEEGLSRTHFGSGLGLAITRHLVELMDGTIEAHSRKGKGSTFTVVFPLWRGSTWEACEAEEPRLLQA